MVFNIRKNFSWLLALILISFFIYAFNLNSPLFWDDDEWVKGNIFVHSFSYLKEIFTQNVEAGFGLNSNYYRPLLLLSFLFNYAIHGIAPLGYHLLSNGFHIANGVLIFFLLARFLNQRAAFIAGLLFLIHPVQTEAVSYISGRGDPMSVFFMLLALWFYVKYSEVKKKLFVISSLLFVILAVLSRETAILFPLLLTVFCMSFLFKDRFFLALKKSFLVSLPFWLVSAVYFVLRLTVFNFKSTLNFFDQPNIYSENMLYRFYTFGHALIEYFRIIFWPVGLHMERDLPVATSLFQWPVWLGALAVFSILYVVYRFYKRERSPYTKYHIPYTNFRIWFFGWFWFFIALGPVSGVIPINALIYEHWLYLPLIGFAVFAGFYINKLLEFLKIREQVIGYWLLVIGLTVYLSFFAVQSIRRNILWGKPIDFYEDILKYDPKSVRILTNLGNLYSEKGDLSKAEELFKSAIASPDSSIFAQPHYNLGNIYRDKGRIDEAMEQYKEAIEADPSFPFAYQNLATAYINNKRDLVRGAETLEQLKKIQPGNARVYYNLGLVYLATGDNNSAISNFETGLELARGRDEEVERAISEMLGRIK